MQRLQGVPISKLAHVLVAQERLAIIVRQNKSQLDDTAVSAASEKCNSPLRPPPPLLGGTPIYKRLGVLLVPFRDYKSVLVPRPRQKKNIKDAQPLAVHSRH